MRALSPLNIPRDASIKELHQIIQNSVRDMCVGSSSAVGAVHSHLNTNGVDDETVQTMLTQFFRGILLDDCESTAELAALCRKTLLSMPDNAPELMKALMQWPSLFKDFTPRCYDLLSRICNRGVSMLRSGILKITTGVGLATGAAASDGADGDPESQSYNGHCFNIGRVTTSPPSGVCSDPVVSSSTQSKPSQSGVSCFLLEGTAPMDEFKIDSSHIKVPLSLWSEKTGEFSTTVVGFLEYLTILAQGVTGLLQVSSFANGGMGKVPGRGWPVDGPPVNGWVSSTIFTNSLDSDRSAPLSFYNRVMYTGFECVQNGLGCMPVQEKVVGSDTVYVTGCHPYDLNDMSLRALNATIPPEKLATMEAIMNEATPPMVDHSVLKRLSEYWAPCTPLVAVNVESSRKHVPGLRYFRVACMETTAIPEFTPIMCKAKYDVCELANSINEKLPQSDGAFFVCNPNGEGTGCHVFIDIPYQQVIPTIAHSLRDALQRMQWPGYLPLVKK